jgi:hypothetical protein
VVVFVEALFDQIRRFVFVLFEGGEVEACFIDTV